MEVLGALGSVLSIWLVTGVLVYEAINRLFNPVEVNGKRAPRRCAAAPVRPPLWPARRSCLRGPRDGAPPV